MRASCKINVSPLHCNQLLHSCSGLLAAECTGAADGGKLSASLPPTLPPSLPGIRIKVRYITLAALCIVGGATCLSGSSRQMQLCHQEGIIPLSSSHRKPHPQHLDLKYFTSSCLHRPGYNKVPPDDNHLFAKFFFLLHRHIMNMHVLNILVLSCLKPKGIQPEGLKPFSKQSLLTKQR